MVSGELRRWILDPTYIVEGRLLAVFLEQPVEFPFIALAVCGGGYHLHRVDGEVTFAARILHREMPRCPRNIFTRKGTLYARVKGAAGKHAP